MNKEEQWLLTEKYSGVENDAFRDDQALLHSGRPLAYIIGSIPFLDCTIFLDSHPLIPRVETEFWVDKAITEVRRSGDVAQILDLCAGSGVIGVSIANALQNTHVTFGEINIHDIPTIKKNLIENQISADKYEIIESDLFENIVTKFHYIFTNPPYIDPTANTVDVSVATHEPYLALYGGIKGLQCIKKIISQAPAHLHEHGQLWIEHEPEQTTDIHKMASESNFYCTTHNDQYEVERYSVLVLQ